MALLHIEWHKRFAIAGACLVFGLFGVGLSLGQKKEARSAAFVVSVAAILCYYVFLRLGEQFGVPWGVPAWICMWTANLVFGGAAVWLLILNQREAAFDPLDPAHYVAWLPRVRRRPGLPPRRARILATAESPSSRPRFRLWGLLDGYIATSYFGHLLLATLSFLSLTLLLEFMDLVDDISQHGLPFRILFKYLAFAAPDRLTLILPVAFLVGTLTTLGLMARRNEITAMKAGGISVYRVAVPVMVSAVLGGVALFALSEFVVPYTNRIARRELDVIKDLPLQSTARQVEQRMVLGRSGRFYELTSTAARPEVLHSFWTYDVDPETWRLRECLYAGQARWNHYGGFYDMEHGWRRRVTPSPVFRAFESVRTREIEKPEYFRREATTSAGTMRFGELRAHIRDLAALGIDVVRLEVDLQRKLALPAVAVVMALLGIPFAFVVGRRGALYGIGLALLLAIVYWSCFKVFEGLGVNALLDPALAMWAPNILFAGAAVYLLLCLDT
jgi:LPS export ABC transporter permease LptG